jgi:hypothetical protein
MSHQRQARQKAAAKQRRAENRELAEIERSRRRRRARLVRVGLWSGAVLVVVAIVGGAGLGIRAHIRAGEVGPVNMASDGLLLTGDGSTISPSTTPPIPAGGTPTPSSTSARSTGMIDFVVYVDYGDPRSAASWSALGPMLTSAVTSGYATLEIHPIALDANRSSYTSTATPAPAPTPTGTETATPTPVPTPNPSVTDVDYSQRAANAFACVASYQPSAAVKMNDALFSAQASFGAAGLTDKQLVSTAKTAGATSDKVSGCITSHSYVDWVQQATDRAATTTPFDSVGAITQTPTVVVAGQPYTGSLESSSDFYTFVSQVYSSLTAGSDTGSTATPAPTATATP